MNIPVITPDLIEDFILVFIRIISILVMIPVLGDKVAPAPVKWGLALFITLLLFPLVRSGMTPPAGLPVVPLSLRLAGEILIGVSIGFAARLIFAGVQLAGEMLGVQIGFSIANVLDPSSNLEISLVAEFKYMLSMLLFLSVDAHHIFIRAMAESYQVVRPLNVHFTGELLQVIVRLSRDLFVIAVKISAPVMAVLLFTNVALGVVARTVPQMNIFVVSFPLQISVGLLFIGLTAPIFVQLLQRFFSGLTGTITLMMRLLGGG